jgi:hypothetical protein
MKNGFVESESGRAGAGVYVSDSIEGAIAEFEAHNAPSIPVVLEVEYTSGNATFIGGFSQEAIVGYIPVEADTLVYESVRMPGALNAVIRNGSASAVREVF